MAVTSVLRVVEGEAISYRRVWRGTVISTFLQPVLFLAAMGLGLGSLVDRGGGDSSLPVSYLAFVATGLVAAAAMQTGAGDGAWPVMVGIKWRKNFHATIVTPVSVGDLILGRLGWGAIRLTVIVSVYTVIVALFQAVPVWPGVLGIAPAVLTGLAFAAPITAFTARLEDDTGLSSLFRFGIVPLFLFSGTFFPITQLPGWLQPIAAFTPLFHGVELVRKLVLPELEAPLVSATPLWLHVAYLGAMTAIGVWLAIRAMRTRLQP